MPERVLGSVLKGEVSVGLRVDGSQFFDVADHQVRHGYHAELFSSDALPCC